MPKDLKLAELFVIITYTYCSSQGFLFIRIPQKIID